MAADLSSQAVRHIRGERNGARGVGGCARPAPAARALAPLLTLLACTVGLARASADERLLTTVEIADVRADAQSVFIWVDADAVSHAAPHDPREHGLFVVAGDDPVGLFAFVATDDVGAIFAHARPADRPLPANRAAWRAWRVEPGAVGVLRGVWPEDAVLRAQVDSVGPARRTVWIRAGHAQGISIDDHWWQRNRGQPVARYDVLFVAADVCFARVVPLAATFRPHAGDGVTLWPRPGVQRDLRAESAVCFVESGEGAQRAWIAAPRHVDVPSEPRVEFHRDGVFVGSGVCEQRDDRFWYVRVLDAGATHAIEVGDDARIRTTRDVEHRRYVARVFDQTDNGYLINAGQHDGVSVGDVAIAWRSGRPIARLRVTQTRSAFARAVVDEMFPLPPSIQPTDSTAPAAPRPSDDPPTRLTNASPPAEASPAVDPPREDIAPPNDVTPRSEITPHDEIRFTPPASAPERIGRVERVADGLLVAINTDAAKVPDGAKSTNDANAAFGPTVMIGSNVMVGPGATFSESPPRGLGGSDNVQAVAVRRQGVTIAVGIAVEIGPERVFACLLPASITEPPRPGDEVTTIRVQPDVQPAMRDDVQDNRR